MARASIRKQGNEIESILRSLKSALSEEDSDLRRRLQGSFVDFVKALWPHSGVSEPYCDGWHIHAICDHLEALYRRDIRNLLINVPPRCGKSSLTTVLFPAWVWANDPREKFLCASYVQTLSDRDSNYCRRVIISPLYQKLWGYKVTLTGDVNSKRRFENTNGGVRIATSVGGATTGEGGNFLIVDDGNSSRDVDSDTIREGTNDWYDKSWSTRMNNPNTSCRLVTQQRLHERDQSGHIINKDVNEEWVKLIIPMEYEVDRHCVTIPLKRTKGEPWQDPREKEGQLMWPQRLGPKALASLKSELGSEYAISGQLQQRPAPESGGIIKRFWFRWWEESETPDLQYVLQSWDTALVGEKSKGKNTAAFSACTTWGVFNDDIGRPNIILLSLYRGRIEMPELYEMAQRLYNNYHDTELDDPLGYPGPKPDMVMVEAKSNGLSLIQMLSRAGVLVSRFDPNKHGSKKARARLMSPMIEGGRVWVPAAPPDFSRLRPQADQLVEACALFPNGESADIVDSMSQAVIRLTESGSITHPDDPQYFPSYKHLSNPKLYG